MHCEPKRAAASCTNSGLWIAAVLIPTLSAPAFSRLRISPSSRMPPPTVSGMNTSLAMRSTVRAWSRGLVAGGDVEEGDLVGALLVVAARDFHRVAGVADIDEAHALDHAPAVDVEARE
jgi:hypothetical protein